MTVHWPLVLPSFQVLDGNCLANLSGRGNMHAAFIFRDTVLITFITLDVALRMSLNDFCPIPMNCPASIFYLLFPSFVASLRLGLFSSFS